MRIGPVEFKRQGPGVAGSNGHRELSEVLSDLDIIEVNVEENYVVASKRLEHPLVARSTDRPKLRELGSMGTRWRNTMGGDEYNSLLRGKNGLTTFDQMRRSDGTVAQLLKIIKTPILAADWFVDTADPEDDLANQQAQFVENNLFLWMSTGWIQVLSELLTMFDFGYSYFEKVFDYHVWEGERRVIWRKLATRSPEDVVEWHYDRHGGPSKVEVTDYEGKTNVFIDIEDLLVFTYRKEAGNVEGRSALREAYKHWYYKENLYKIDAIQKERHGIGVPVIKLPPNFTAADKQLADELGRNLRTNEWAHIVLPPFWEVEFAEVRGQTVDVMKSIDHHDRKILDSGIAGFALKADNKSDAEIVMDVFMSSLRHVAEMVAEVFNLYAIPQLISHNWMGVEKFPQLKVRHIGQVADLRTISFAVRNLVGAGVIKPDDPLEDYLRDLNHLPRRDPSTERELPAPQSPFGGGGMPRQGPPSAGPPAANAGNDASGGE